QSVRRLAQAPRLGGEDGGSPDARRRPRSIAPSTGRFPRVDLYPLSGHKRTWRPRPSAARRGDGRRHRVWLSVVLRRAFGPRHQVRKSFDAALVAHQHLRHRHRDPAAGGVDVPQLLRIVLNIEDPWKVEVQTIAGHYALASLAHVALGRHANF